MLTSSNSRKGNLIPFSGGILPHVFPILMLFSMMMFSCTNFGYKDEVYEVADSIMSTLRDGNSGQYSETDNSLDFLSSEQILELNEEFKNLEKWDIAVENIKNGSVRVVVDFQIDSVNRSMDLFFVKIEDQWVPRRENLYEQKIQVVPFVGAKSQ